MVTLYGTILREIDGRILIDLAPQLGDAPRFGLAGQHWFAKRQCLLQEARQRGELDVVQISFALASLKSQSTTNQSPSTPRRRVR